MSFGFILINKPIGPTSHDIVDRIRRITAIKTVGHAGTLDPFASGLLIIGVGREATKEFVKLVGLDKKYRATVHFGAVSDSHDRTGIISSYPNISSNSPVTLEKINLALKGFIGETLQIPPMHSAKKVNGQKLYKLAREGKTVERPPTPINIYSITPEATTIDPIEQKLVLNIHSSSGTYIRAIARDLGEALGTGAYLEELERTAIGPFNLSEAVKTEELTKETWEKYLISPNQAIARCQSSPHMLG